MNKIPSRLMVGPKWFTVEHPKIMYKYGCMGSVRYDIRVINVASHSSRTGKRFTPAQQENTFWHELTHAILNDMGSPLCTDERFVTLFADRLTKAIRTARFK